MLYSPCQSPFLFPTEIELGVLEDEFVVLVGESLHCVCRGEQSLVGSVAYLIVEDNLGSRRVLIGNVYARLRRIEDGAVIANVHIDDGGIDVVIQEVIVAKPELVAPTLACILQIERVRAMPDNAHEINLAEAHLKFTRISQVVISRLGDW